MPGMLLYRFESTDGSITERLDQRYPAVAVEQQQYFDDVDVYYGELADKHYVQQEVAHGSEDGIVTQSDEVPEYAHADWLVAPTAGLAGISSSAAERTLDGICLQDLGSTPREAAVDLESFVDAEVDSARADIWAVSYSDGDREDGVDPTRAGARYHNDARLSDIDIADVSLLGVDLVWDGRAIQALVCESGWVAVHEDDVTMPQFVRWVHDCVGPHLLNPLDDQTTLGGGD